jgi:uncharacterized protein DUF6270
MVASRRFADPVRVAVFGSCVTRDLFEDPLMRPSLVHYAARSSIISAVAPPVPIAPDAVALDSAWQHRCVLADFGKTFFASLEEARPDWLLIDLIDERFDVIRTAGSFVTRSSALQSAQLAPTVELDFEVVPRLSDDGLALFDDAAAEFVRRIVEILPPERVVVHRAVWLERFRYHGETLRFDTQRLEFARLQNTALERGYHTLLHHLGDQAGVLTLSPVRYAADAHHRWELEPFHYEPAYNREAVRHLRRRFSLARAAAA